MHAGKKSNEITFVLAAAVIVIMFSILRLAIEVLQTAKSLIAPYEHRYEYLLDLSNWLEVPLFVSAIIFSVSVFNSQCSCLQASQWSFGIVALVLAWGTLVILMRKLEIFGKIQCFQARKKFDKCCVY